MTAVTDWVAAGPLKDFKLTVNPPSECLTDGKVTVRFRVELPPASYAMTYARGLGAELDDKTGAIVDADERRTDHTEIAEQLAAVAAFEADPEVLAWVKKYAHDIQLESGVGWAKWCVRYTNNTVRFLKYCPDGVGVAGYELENLADATRPEAEGLADMLKAKLSDCRTTWVSFYREIDDHRIDTWKASGTLFGEDCDPSSFDAHKNVGMPWMLD